MCVQVPYAVVCCTFVRKWAIVIAAPHAHSSYVFHWSHQPTDRLTDRREEDSYRPPLFLLRQRRCIKRESVVILCPKERTAAIQLITALVSLDTAAYERVRRSVGCRCLAIECSTVNERVCWDVLRVRRMKSNEATKCPTDADVFPPFVVLSFD